MSADSPHDKYLRGEIDGRQRDEMLKTWRPPAGRSAHAEERHRWYREMGLDADALEPGGKSADGSAKPWSEMSTVERFANVDRTPDPAIERARFRGPAEYEARQAKERERAANDARIAAVRWPASQR
jgi:hypothetical protein